MVRKIIKEIFMSKEHSIGMKEIFIMVSVCGQFYIFIGSWEENKLSGLGIFIFAFGGTIEGNFLKGRLEGLNRINLINGLTYTGFWK